MFISLTSMKKYGFLGTYQGIFEIKVFHSLFRKFLDFIWIVSCICTGYST